MATRLFACWLVASCTLTASSDARAQLQASELDTPGWLAVGCKAEREQVISSIQAPRGIDSLALFASVIPSKKYFRTRAESELPEHERLGTYGRECGAARNRAECERRVAEFAKPTAACREHLECPAFAIMTAGDRVWRADQPADLKKVLRSPLETVGEGLIIAVLDGFKIECLSFRQPTVIRRSEEGLGFELRNPGQSMCTYPYARVFVGRDGTTKQNSFKEKVQCVY